LLKSKKITKVHHSMSASTSWKEKMFLNGLLKRLITSLKIECSKNLISLSQFSLKTKPVSWRQKSLSFFNKPLAKKYLQHNQTGSYLIVWLLILRL